MPPYPAAARTRAVTALMIAMSLLLGSVIAVASTAVRPVPAAAATVCDTNEFSCWMGRFSSVIGQRPLNQVVQPGSHDTGTYNIQNDGSLARNQNADVYTSLARGVRQFDIRAHPRTLGGRTEMYAYHGSVDTDVKLDTMLNDVIRYTSSPGTSREIIYLHITTDQTEGGQTLVDSCRAWAPRLAPYLLPSSALYSRGQMKSVNEIWALPGSPRVIAEWGGCSNAGTVLSSSDWSANGDYYANQGNTPCVKYAVTKALEGRWSGTEDSKRGQDVPYSYQQGNPCWNYGNVPAGSQPMTRLDRNVTGLYTMYIQQTGLVPSSALYVQRDVLSMLVDYWDRNVGSARANLNYVSADFVLDGDTSLLTRTIGLNTRTVLPRISRSIDTSDPDPSKWRYTYVCGTLDDSSSGTRLTAWTPSETGPSGDAVQLSLSQLTLPVRSTALLRCADGSGRRARFVQGNRIASVGVVNQSVPADRAQLDSSPTVVFTDAYGSPVVGQDVTFSVTGPGRLSTDGKTSLTVVTDGSGRASAPVYLTHATGKIAVTASAPRASQTVPFAATVVAAAAKTISATSGDQQSVAQNAPFGAPLVVTVKDAYGNGAPGQAVVFKVESGPASLGGQATSTVTTGADGTASITVQSGGTDGDVVVSATTGSLRTTFSLQVIIVVQGPGPRPTSADTSVEVKGPKKIALGKTGTIKVSVVNAGPDPVPTWYSLVTVGSGLKITGTSMGAASGRVVQLSGDDLATDDAVDFTVTVRAVHRGQVGYAVLAGSDVTDPDDQNDSEVKVLKVT